MPVPAALDLRRVPAAVRGRTAGLEPEVLVLVGIAVVVALGFGVVAPVIPLFAREFGVGQAAASAVVSAFAFMRLVSALGGGALVERFGERRVLGAGIALVALSALLSALAQTYLQLLLLRAAGGVGSAMFTVSALSLLLRCTAPQRRGQASALFQTGFLVGGIAGPTVGGLVAGFSFRAPFVVYAVLLLVAGAIGLTRLPREPEHDDAGAGRRGGGGATLGAAVRTPEYRAAVTCWFGHAWHVFGVRQAVVPLLVVEGLGYDAVWAGVALTVSALVTVLVLVPAGRRVDELGRRPLLLAGTALTAVGFAGLALVAAVQAPLPLFLLAMLVLGAGAGLLGPAPGAAAGDVVARLGEADRGDDDREDGDRGDGDAPAGGASARRSGGKVIAAFQMAGDLGAVSGPLVAGALADGPGFGVAFAVCAGVLLLGTAAAAVAPEPLDRRDAAADARSGTDDEDVGTSPPREAAEPPPRRGSDSDV